MFWGAYMYVPYVCMYYAYTHPVYTEHTHIAMNRQREEKV